MTILLYEINGLVKWWLLNKIRAMTISLKTIVGTWVAESHRKS